jgi:predicted Zn-dependent protease
MAACASAPVLPSPGRAPVCAVPPRGAAAADPAPTGVRPEALLAQAAQLRAAGDLAGARQRLERAAVTAPGDPGVCLALADVLLAEGADLDRVGAMLWALPPATPRRDEALGRLADLRGDPATAEAAYARALLQRPDPQVQLRRAQALEKLGRLPEAILELERLRAATPADPLVRLRLAELYEATGRLVEAEAELRGLAEAAPARPEGWRRLAAFCTRHALDDKARVAEARAHDAELRPRRDLRPLRPTGR